MALPQIVFQCWATFNPRARAELVVVFHDEDQSLGREECRRPLEYWWVILLELYFFLLPCGIIAILAIGSKDLPKLFNESVHISNLSHIAGTALVVGVPLIASTTNKASVSPDVSSFLYILLTLIVTMVPELFLIIPKLKLVWSHEKIVISTFLQQGERFGNYSASGQQQSLCNNSTNGDISNNNRMVSPSTIKHHKGNNNIQDENGHRAQVGVSCCSCSANNNPASSAVVVVHQPRTQSGDDSHGVVHDRNFHNRDSFLNNNNNIHERIIIELSPSVDEEGTTTAGEEISAAIHVLAEEPEREEHPSKNIAACPSGTSIISTVEQQQDAPSTDITSLEHLPAAFENIKDNNVTDSSSCNKAGVVNDFEKNEQQRSNNHQTKNYESVFLKIEPDNSSPRRLLKDMMRLKPSLDFVLNKSMSGLQVPQHELQSSNVEESTLVNRAIGWHSL